jgi:Domain of unknown function (DUF4157)
MQRKAIARTPSRQPGSSPSRSRAAALARPAQQHGAIGNQAATRRLQAKLRIAASGDRHEQEADRVAAQVVAAPARNGVSSAPPHIGRVSGQPDARTNAASVDSVLAEPGTPLQPALRHDMEQRFARDFSQVRVHSDAAAAQSARDVDANAYTVGSNIVFGTPRFAPQTSEGRRLIAHELTHVVQQSRGGIAVGGRDGGRSAGSVPGLIQREPDDDKKAAPQTTPTQTTLAKTAPTQTTPAQTTPTKTLKSQGVGLSDPVGSTTAAIIDEVLLRNQRLAPYIGDKLKGGFSIAQKGKFVQEPSDSQFETAFRAVNGSDPPKSTVGFFDPKKSVVHLRPTAQFGTALHESVHRLASPALFGSFFLVAQDISTDLLDVLKEGVTAYFTDKILNDEGLPNFNDAYRSQKHKVEALETALKTDGFDVIAKFNFQANITAIGEKLGVTPQQFQDDFPKRLRAILTQINKAI